MHASPSWFLYADYLPPDRTRFLSVAAITFVMRLRYRAYRGAASDLMQRSRMASWLPVPAKAWALNAVNIQ
ncbi:hypothetical protein PIN31009_03836 [Pandoraea iniqua]|uniref:Uncharacterized protein n=1 Tax=Pandoraea iniqua TaxID=2508288 RepID=A0A5E4XSS2_9BURK|nr:hypothetical protein PIN31009_03836 [Pandoraea iniqua]VVE39427.1 hypothetical protein PIN31115_04058 [Pandoraea iniqua]